MGLFKKKPKAELSLPDFPDIQKEKIPAFPSSFEPEKFVPKHPELPKRLPKLELMPKLTDTITYEPKKESISFGSIRHSKYEPPKIERPFPIERPKAPQLKTLTTTEPLPQRREQKPLFVQIEEYNRIVDTINSIKFTVQEAEKILDDLKSIKEKEIDELSRWNENLNEIKKKLLAIDRRIFEV